MKRFAFQLEALLTWRTQLKEQALLAWQRANEELRKAVAERARLWVLVQGWQELQREKQAAFVLAGELMRSYQVAHQIHLQWRHQDRVCHGLERLVQQAFERWREAERKAEVLLNLKSRSRASWRLQYEREEQKLSDERAGLLAFFHPPAALEREAGVQLA